MGKSDNDGDDYVILQVIISSNDLKDLTQGY